MPRIVLQEGLDELKAIFPQYDEAFLLEMLKQQNGNMENTVALLLSINDEGPLNRPPMNTNNQGKRKSELEVFGIEEEWGLNLHRSFKSQLPDDFLVFDTQESIYESMDEQIARQLQNSFDEEATMMMLHMATNMNENQVFAESSSSRNYMAHPNQSTSAARGTTESGGIGQSLAKKGRELKNRFINFFYERKGYKRVNVAEDDLKNDVEMNNNRNMYSASKTAVIVEADQYSAINRLRTMFSYARSIMDYLKSSAEMWMNHGMIIPNITEERKEGSIRKSSGKVYSPKAYVAHTSLFNSLDSFKQAILTARSLGYSTLLIEEDLVSALNNYCTLLTLKDGKKVLIRPILPSDTIRMKEILEKGEVSQNSLSLRFNTITISIKESMIEYFCNVDYDTHFAIGAFVYENGVWKGVATARIIQDGDNEEYAEWAALVMDSYHDYGIGSCMLYYLSQMASHFGIKQLNAIIHQRNYPVLHWMKKLNATRQHHKDCCYWFFGTPLPCQWIWNEESRLCIEQAACGNGNLNEEGLNVLRDHVKVLCTSINAEECHTNNKLSLNVNRDKQKRQAPQYSFVSSFEDDLELGDMF